VNGFGLDIGWASTASERRRLHWELLACERVLGAFVTPRENVLAVLFSGDRRTFDRWARTVEPQVTGWSAFAVGNRRV
jgi:hypothetical protein